MSNPVCWYLRGAIDPIFTISNFFDRDEVDHIHKLAEGYPIEEGKIHAFKDNVIFGKLMENVRRSSVRWMDPKPEIESLYRKIVDSVLEVNAKNFNYNLVGLESLQYTEYFSDQLGCYGIHSDVRLHLNSTLLLQRKLSFSIQLSDPSEYEGGELVIVIGKDEIIASKDIGTIIFFPSTITHEVKPVTSGLRRSLVGWVYGPQLS